ncbi:hypothetical protein HMPREF0765_4604 [Sphingobacterium spiritivorum ATCC 33300]|uniref:Uncharacterized protein n=1 Tax=Sphingobacterium spiritivorum ATCC 33300 TaxID=525372 RepID=C2G4U8_SPHSI|nr:hypothetical protein HMPREF0765_4604 [Sphingobacterium spiritivorum ATCC 33300]
MGSNLTNCSFLLLASPYMPKAGTATAKSVVVPQAANVGRPVFRH